MASLQTLRNKGGVIVALVIGIALIAFVLGDLLGSGSALFGDSRNNAGEIDGTTIGGIEYQNQLDYVTEIQKITSGSEATTDETNQQLKTQAWDLLVREYAFKPHANKAGLTVSEAEMEEMVMGQNISPVIAQVFADPKTGIFDIEYLRAFVSNIPTDQSGRLEMFWNYIQNEAADQAQLFKFRDLSEKAAYITNFEAEKTAEMLGKSYSVRFVADKYSVADSVVSISEAEIRRFYNQNHNMFMRPASRDIEYVTFEALPSDEDKAAAEKYFAGLAEEFETTDNIQQFVSLNSQTPLDSRYYKEGMLTGSLAEFAFSAKKSDMFGPEFSGDRWTMSRISDVKALPDSVSVSVIVISADNKQLADSLQQVLSAKNADFAQAAIQYSIDPQSGASGGDLGTFDPQTLPEMLAGPILNAKKGEVFTIDTPNGVYVMKLRDIIGVSEKVQLASVTYTVEASEPTRNMTYTKANSFATAVAGGLTSFRNTAREDVLSIRNEQVSSTDASVIGLQNSRELVRWAFLNKRGDISKVMEFGNTFVVAALTGVAEQGLAPLDDDQTRNIITSILRQDKKGEIIAAKMKDASSVDQMAQQMGLNVVDGNDITFQTFMIPQVGMDPAFAGALTGMNPASVSKPVLGNIAVYGIEITDSQDKPVAVDFEKSRLSTTAQNMAFRNAYTAFLDMCEIKDLRYRFQ